MVLQSQDSQEHCTSRNQVPCSCTCTCAAHSCQYASWSGPLHTEGTLVPLNTDTTAPLKVQCRHTQCAIVQQCLGMHLTKGLSNRSQHCQLGMMPVAQQHTTGHTSNTVAQLFAQAHTTQPTTTPTRLTTEQLAPRTNPLITHPTPASLAPQMCTVLNAVNALASPSVQRPRLAHALIHRAGLADGRHCLLAWWPRPRHCVQHDGCP